MKNMAETGQPLRVYSLGSWPLPNDLAHPRPLHAQNSPVCPHRRLWRRVECGARYHRHAILTRRRWVVLQSWKHTMHGIMRMCVMRRDVCVCFLMLGCWSWCVLLCFLFYIVCV